MLLAPSAWRAFVREQRFLVRDLPVLERRLGEIAAPTTIVAGTADRVVPIAAARRLATQIPGADLVELEDAGHLLHIKHAGELANVIAGEGAGVTAAALAPVSTDRPASAAERRRRRRRRALRRRRGAAASCVKRREGGPAMPNLRVGSAVIATTVKRRRLRRRIGWWRTIKVMLFLERWRRRRERSSPSLRQIALVVVSAGIAIVLIRGAARRAAKRGGEGADAQAAPAKPPVQTTPGANSAFTERVRGEMFGRSDAPAPSSGTG